MSRISRATLACAISKVEAMNQAQQEDLADEVFKYQPDLFGSVLALRRLGVPADRMVFPVKVLLVCFQAMKESGLVWPRVNETDLSRQLNRWLSSVQMGGDVGPSLSTYSTQVYIDAHPEKDLLAFVTSGMADLLNNTKAQETDRFVMMAVQNLVNCIAYVDFPKKDK